MTLNKKLIENVKFLKKSINEISVYDLEVYSALELYSQIAKKLNEVIKELLRFEGGVSEEVVNQNNIIKNLLTQGLIDEVVKKINEMYIDGSFETILNNKLFSELNDEIKEKASVKYVDDKFTLIGDGSPKGVYSTLDELNRAFPNGDKNIYLVSENGHWYYWNNSWVDGGVYQSSQLGDKTVKPKNLSSELIELQKGMNLAFDPLFENQSDLQADIEKHINKDIYKSIKKTSSLINFINNKIKFNTIDNPSFTPVYIQNYNINNKMLERGLSLSINLNYTVGSPRIGIQFYKENNTKISELTKEPKESSIIKFENISIPNETSYFRFFIMVGNAVASAFECGNLIINYGSSLITLCDDTYYKNIVFQKDLKTNSIDISSFNELKNAIGNYNNINIVNDIEVTEELMINSNVNIFGNNNKLTGKELTRHLMLISNSNVFIKSLKMKNGLDSVLTCIGNYNVILEDCDLHYSEESVVSPKGNGILSLKKCDIGYSKKNDGLAPKENAKTYVYDCKIHDNFDEGISSHNDCFIEIVGGEYYNNGYVVGTADSSKQQGAISSFGGIHIGGGKMGKVKNTSCYNNRTYGIALINFMNPTLDDIEICENNLIYDNGSYGVFCTACHDFVINNNTIFNNKGGVCFGKDISYQYGNEYIASQGLLLNNNIFNNDKSIEIEDKQSELYNLMFINNKLINNKVNEIIKPNNINLTIF